MASAKAKSKTVRGRKPAAAKRTRGKLAPGGKARGLDAAEVAIAMDSADIADVVAFVRSAGGALIGAYREPLGGRPLVIASLPLGALQPTPFQRDLSPTHAKRLALKIDEAAAFLDPLIVVRGEDGRLWTPNGRHRLAAGKVLGLKQITALISPDETLAYRILALNTEKAHNLRDRSLEVIRMARSLAKRQASSKEVQYSAEFESAELLTLGIVYEKSSRFAGGAQLLPEEGGPLQRTLAASLRTRGVRRAPARDRCRTKRVIAALQARADSVALPAKLCGGAHQPGAFSQSEERRDQAAHAVGAGPHAHGGSRQEVQH